MRYTSCRGPATRGRIGVSYPVRAPGNTFGSRFRMSVRTLRPPRASGSWLWLLALFSLAGFVETTFWGQMNAFTPLYLPTLGIAARDVALWTGIAVSASNAVGLPLLPFWGALADRYARQPVIVRSFAVHAP